MIRALILDDEKASLTQLRESIERYIPDITQIWATSDPAEAMMLINEQNPQLLFLDIEMPQMNGFEYLEKVNE